MRSVSKFLALALTLSVFQASAATVEETISEKISASDSRIHVTHVEKSTLDGLYLVELDGGDFLFSTKDATQFIQGNQYGLDDSGKIINISDRRRQASAAKDLAAVPVEDMIIYPAVGEKKATINVFSDPTCPYCKLLHHKIPDLNKAGLEVRYLAFPREGLGSGVHANMASAWCSENRQDAMNKLFEGQAIPEVKCKNPVADEFLLGEKLGIRGTPTIILENGKKMIGVQSAEDMLKELGVAK
jgi:thiol:disulfide interchange protein DsbC